jgi:RNA-directed DNA polymerase
MVVAYKHNNLEEVFRLQDKLIMSYKGRCLAVRKVTSNQGGKTPGVDKII